MRSTEFVKSLSLLLNGDYTGVEESWFHFHLQEFYPYAISFMDVLMSLQKSVLKQFKQLTISLSQLVDKGEKYS